ncbi:MAG: MarR family transcriptional regulator [Lachnospiraceae bacterium]|nr:MarR family transcriptional regulator [Lachnospiraceae bacterium]
MDCSSALRLLNIAMRKNFNREMKDFKLTGPQAETLIYLFYRKKPEVNQKDIERVTGLTNPTVSGILNRLEEKNLIRREVCKRDGRYRTIELTEEAIAIKAPLCKYGDRADARLVEGLTEEEQQLFRKVVAHMIENLRKYGGEL